MTLEIEMEDGSVKIIENVKSFSEQIEEVELPPDEDDEDQDEGEISGDDPDDEPDLVDEEEN